MRSLLNGCRAVYAPVTDDRSYPVPLIGDGPRLRYWHDDSEFTNSAPAITYTPMGPCWDLTAVAKGLWAHAPKTWRSADGALWQAPKRGATVLWYGYPTGTESYWQGLAGLVFGAADNFPWGVLSLRRSAGGAFAFQTNVNGNTYQELVSSITTASRLAVPTVAIGVIRPVGNDTFAELLVDGVLDSRVLEPGSAALLSASFDPMLYIGSPFGTIDVDVNPLQVTRLVGMWDRALTSQEMVTLTRSPLLLEKLARTPQRGLVPPVRTYRPQWDVSAVGWSAT